MGSEVSHCAANDGARCSNRCGQGDDIEWEFSPHGARPDIDTVEVLSRDLKPLHATHGSPQKRQRPQEESKSGRKAEVIRSSSNYLEQDVARSSSHYMDGRGKVGNGIVRHNSGYPRSQSPPARPQQPASQSGAACQPSGYTVVSKLHSSFLVTQGQSKQSQPQPQHPELARENPGSGRTEETKENRMNNFVRNEAAKRHTPSCGSSAATTAPPSVGGGSVGGAGSIRAPMAQQATYAGNPGSFVQAPQLSPKLSPKPQGSYTAAAPPQLVSFVQGRPGQRPPSPVRIRAASPGRLLSPTAMRCNSMPIVQRKPAIENPPTDSERRSWKAAAEDPGRKLKPGDALALERPKNSNLVSRQTTNNQVLKSSDFRKRLEGLEEAARGLR